jgi:hypothetical protein
MKVKAQRIIRPDEFAALFDNAYSTLDTIVKGLSGFKATGIYPLNPNVFTDEDFQQEWEDKDTSSKPQILTAVSTSNPTSKLLALFTARFSSYSMRGSPCS